MSFSKRVRELRTSMRLTQSELSTATGISKSSISMYENGNRIPELETFERLADFFNVDLDYLKGKSDIKRSADYSRKGLGEGLPVLLREFAEEYSIKHYAPILGRVPAGVPIEAIEDIVGQEEITEKMARGGDYFGLIIDGDSMEPRIRKGDLVLVRKQPDVDSGDVAIVLIDGCDATCKKIIKNESGIMLVSTNPKYEPKFYSWEDIKKVPIAILGRAVYVKSYL